MTPKKLKERKERITKLNRALAKLYPDATTELKYKTPWQFMVAVQLSAQCTDKRVNIITKELFKKYKTLDDYLKADYGEFEKMIHSCTYSFNKARNILAAAKFVKGEYKGKLPRTMAELIKIPGVGRKTANVFLGDIHGIYEGVTVDTHVIRFVQRFDLSDYKDTVRIERDLMQLLPQKEWRLFTHRVIFYGRYLAPARKYDTSKDPLIKIYPPAAKRFRV
jgi:endonuclease-3